MLFRKLFARKNSRPVAAPNRDRSNNARFNNAAKPGTIDVSLNPIALLVSGATRY